MNISEFRYSNLGCNLQNSHCVGDSVAITQTFLKLQHLQNTLRASLTGAWLHFAKADLTRDYLESKQTIKSNGIQ